MENNQKKPRESLEEFSKRVGLKYVKGGQEFSPGGNLLPKKPKQRESFAEFCKRLGIKHNSKQGGVEFIPATFLVKQLKSEKRSGGQQKSKESKQSSGDGCNNA
jgi:hypothetical protein